MNVKVFALDEMGHRYKFDIMDTVSEKLKNGNSGVIVTSIYLGIGWTN